MNTIAAIRAVTRFIRSLGKNKRGNVLMVMAFSVIPLTLAGGIAVDYSRAARLQTKLNAAADAAALAAVSHEMMKQDNAAATAAATNMFKAQIMNQPGLIWNDADLRVTITGNNAAATSRTATVTYTAKSTNAFAGIIGTATVTIGGTATATATAAPNIDFYLALDTSPSMALPTTSQGFTDLDTPLKCSFACHSNKIEANYGTSSTSSVKSLIRNIDYYLINKPTTTIGSVNGREIMKIDANGTYVYTTATVTDTIDPNFKVNGGGTKVQDLCKAPDYGNRNMCVYNADGSFVDSYWYALNKNVRLRVTDEKAAAKDLMTLAQSYAQANSRTYRAALYTFDHDTNIKKIFPTGPSAPTLSDDLPAVGDAANKIDLVTVNDKSANGCPPTGCTSKNKYLFTSYKSILDKMTAELPKQSGKGSNDPGDTPQAFLFLVTDGMSDEYTNNSYSRTRSAMLQEQINQCKTLKDRGIQIAILYTEYTVDSIKDDAPDQKKIATDAIPDIAPQLTKCASPGLMYTVKTDESISEALQALFTKAVATARLSL